MLDFFFGRGKIMIKSIDPDFYTHMASKLYNKPIEDITFDERKKAKKKFHSLMYNKGEEHGQEEPEAGC